MGEAIVLFLQFEALTQELRVSPFSPLQSLESLLPGGCRYSVYLDDLEISPAFSLKYIGVIDHSVVRAVARPTEPNRLSLRPRRLVDRERHEVRDRLTDQSSNHMEGTVTSYRRLVTRFLNCKGSKAKRKETAVIPRDSVRPATEELPRFW
jgi:hypothetical protein